MQLSRLLTGQGEPPAADYPGGLVAAVAALNAPQSASSVGRQLRAYGALADRWRTAASGERAQLAHALSESPFAQRVQSTLNAFTRAAWAGPDAVPPEPQVRVLKAFDALTEADQQIVAAMQIDRSGSIAPVSPVRYRARLQAELETATALSPPPSATPAITLTLSAEARARLSAATQPEPSEPNDQESAPVDVAPQYAAAVAAYAKAGEARG